MSDKLAIKDLTGAIDMGARDLWNDLDEEQRKQVSFFLLNRYASSVKTSNRDAQEVAVFKTNEYFNKHYFSLSKHPKLLWYLLAMCGNDERKIYFHEWIGHKKKTGDGKIYKFLESVYPSMKEDELELQATLMTTAEAKELARDLGMTEVEIKKIL